jgi:hypothetical protein
LLAVTVETWREMLLSLILSQAKINSGDQDDGH